MTALRKILVCAAVVAVPASAAACDCPMYFDAAAEIRAARADLQSIEFVIDGVVVEPMHAFDLGLTPAVVRPTRTWKGPRLTRVHIAASTNCSRRLTRQGERLRMALLGKEHSRANDISWSEKAKIVLFSVGGGMRDRWRALSPTAPQYGLSYCPTGRAYDQELRRLLRLNSGATGAIRK